MFLYDVVELEIGIVNARSGSVTAVMWHCEERAQFESEVPSLPVSLCSHNSPVDQNNEMVDHARLQDSSVCCQSRTAAPSLCILL